MDILERGGRKSSLARGDGAIRRIKFNNKQNYFVEILSISLSIAQHNEPNGKLIIPKKRKND